MLPAIGSVRTLAEQGRFGVVVGAQPVGEAKDGRQLVALKVKAEAEGQHAATGPTCLRFPGKRTRLFRKRACGSCIGEAAFRSLGRRTSST